MKYCTFEKGFFWWNISKDIIDYDDPYDDDDVY